MDDSILQTQTLQLSECVSLPLPHMGRTSHHPIFFLLQELLAGEQIVNIPVLVTLLFPGLPAVRNAMSTSPIFCSGKLNWYLYYIVYNVYMIKESFLTLNLFKLIIYCTVVCT